MRWRGRAAGSSRRAGDAILLSIGRSHKGLYRPYRPFHSPIRARRAPSIESPRWETSGSDRSERRSRGTSCLDPPGADRPPPAAARARSAFLPRAARVVPVEVVVRGLPRGFLDLRAYVPAVAREIAPGVRGLAIGGDLEGSRMDSNLVVGTKGVGPEEDPLALRRAKRQEVRGMAHPAPETTRAMPPSVRTAR